AAGSSRWSPCSEDLPVATGDADPLAVLVGPVADAGRLAAGVQDHHVGHVDGGFLGHDAAGGGATQVRGVRDVLLDPVHALDEDTVLLRVGLDDLALGALVLTRDDEHGIALVHLHVRAPPGPARRSS